MWIGLAVHAGLEVLLRTSDIEEAVSALQAEWSAKTEKFAGRKDLGYRLIESVSLAEALVRGWHRSRYSGFCEEFEVISIEKETPTLLAPGIILDARVDIVVRQRGTGQVFVWNWKTAASVEGWNAKWQDDVQMWTEALATEHAIGERVAGCIVEGLHKGGRYQDHSTSPLILPMRMFTPSGESIWSPVYRRATKDALWRRAPVWGETFPTGEGVKGWIDWLEDDVLSPCFVRSSPILKNDLVVERWLRQIIRLHTDVKHVLDSPNEQDREDFFFQNFSDFNCGGCTFRRICRGEMSIDDAILGGLLVPREDHHVRKEGVA